MGHIHAKSPKVCDNGGVYGIVRYTRKAQTDAKRGNETGMYESAAGSTPRRRLRGNNGKQSRTYWYKYRVVVSCPERKRGLSK